MVQLVLKGLLTTQEEEEYQGEGKRGEMQPLETGKKKRRQLAGLGQGAGIAEQRQLRALLARWS